MGIAPRDLDRIDELDETNPLGFAMHHDGPYEAIMRAQGSSKLPGPTPSEAGNPQRRTEVSGAKVYTFLP